MTEDYSHPVYKGLFYVYELGKVMRWKEHMEFYKGYAPYCSRMWLDYCDENKHPGEVCLSKSDYTHKYAKWLAKRYIDGEDFS